MGNAHPNIAPYEVVQAADRAFALAATSEVQFARLCGVLGTLELVERYPTNAARVERRAELIAALEARLGEREAREWVTALNEAGVPAALVASVSEVLAGSELVAEVGGVPQLRTPIRIDGAPLPLAGPLPALDEHGAEIRG
jgi:crotonobetainyl-CoA:carnitine CoA-transferase CaiB-like acyl-CoA transferase